jgi:hypothetical protein
VSTIKMDLVADDRRGSPGKRVKRVEDFDLEPETPGIMASRRSVAPAAITGCCALYFFMHRIDLTAQGIKLAIAARCPALLDLR